MQKKLAPFIPLLLAASLFSCSQGGNEASSASSSCSHKFSLVSSVGATCESEGYEIDRCSLCGEEKRTTIAALGHALGEWETTSPATCLTSEKLKRTCTRSGCSYSEEKDGENALGHLWGEWVSQGDKMIRTCQREGCEEKEERDLVLKVFTPTSVVYPYNDSVKEYLSSKDANVANYLRTDDGLKGLTLNWLNTYPDVTAFRLDYSLSESFETYDSLTLSGDQKEATLYNLEKASTYYVRISAENESGWHTSPTSSFTTTDLGPRVMKIDGAHNVRDLGGYLTPEGRTVQGRIFRGGALSPANWAAWANISLTDEGKKYMSETLKIKTEFDLRSRSENRAPGTPEDSGLTESPIPGATLEYHTVNGYAYAFTEKEAYRDVFASLSQESRYPVYIHCTGGADRTGTVSYILNALVGVSEEDLIHDYEYTSFSIYEERNSKTTVYDFQKLVEGIKAFEGDTLSEKVENYLLSIGVTETQIYNLKAIMLGKQTKEEDPEPTIAYNDAFDFSSGNISLSASNATATGVKSGYDGKVYSFKIQESLTSGGTYIFIGSYGFYLRGGAVRYAKYVDGAYGEDRVDGVRETGGNISNSALQAGTILGLSVAEKDENTRAVSIYQNNNLIVSYDYPKASDEIESSSASFVVSINTSDVTSATLSSATDA